MNRVARLSLLLIAAAIGLTTAIAPVGAQQPIRPVPLTPFGDGREALLTQNLEYRILTTDHVVVVPAGFVTDFASTPRILWSVLPPTGRYQLAAVVHDFLYWDQRCTREEADAVFRVAMAESLVDAAKRDLLWKAVRKGGDAAWKTNADDRAAGRPRVVPGALFEIPELLTWPEYRAQLMDKGVRPEPSVGPAPAYCAAAKTVRLP